MSTTQTVEQAVLDIERISPPAEPKFQRETVRAIVTVAINRATEPMQAALERYGQHEHTCPVAAGASDERCTCGLSAMKAPR